MLIKVTVILPVLNEIQYLPDVLNSILADESLSKEILVADGGSTDGTVEWVESFALQNPEVSLIRNTEKYVSNALNLCIPAARGQYIAVLGGHSVYPENYLRLAVEYLDQHPTYTIVGGPITHVAHSQVGKSIAYCMHVLWGMGNSHFRSGKTDMDTDSVPFPVYRKALFEALGGYDPDLIRTQDSDFHYRAIRAGYKIRMLENLRTDYQTRENLKSLMRQFFQYGYYKAYVLVKPGYPLKLRHLIPAFFVLYLAALFTLSLLFPDVSVLYKIPAYIYLMFTLYFASGKWNSMLMFITNMVCFTLMHICYGSGTWVGFFTLIRKKLR